MNPTTSGCKDIGVRKFEFVVRECSVPVRECSVPVRECSVPVRECSVPVRECSVPARKCTYNPSLLYVLRNKVNFKFMDKVLLRLRQFIEYQYQ